MLPVHVDEEITTRPVLLSTAMTDHVAEIEPSITSPKARAIISFLIGRRSFLSIRWADWAAIANAYEIFDFT